MSTIVKLITDALPNLWLTPILALTVILLTTIWIWLKYHYSYWRRQNIPYIEPIPIFGNFKEIVTWNINPCEHFQALYNHENAKSQPVVGLYVFNKPCLLIRDVELIKLILVKDFSKFSNRFSASDPHTDALGSDNLFFAKNPKWKQIRTKLTPVFTSGKMKQMFPLVEEIGREFDEFLCRLPIDPKTSSIVQEVKDINALFSTDVIAIVAYGIRANSLRNPNGDFRRNGKRLFEFTRRRALEFSALFFLPSLVSIFGFKVFSKQTSEFLRDTINYVMDERIKSGTTRNDLIDIMVNFRKEAERARKENDTSTFTLEGDSLVAQAALFFSAGFETSSSTISFTLYELSCHQHIQQRLRDEIRDNLQKNNGKITYDMLNEMTYMNCVVQEVLRLYPPLPFLDRECTLSSDEKGYSLKPYCDFEIPNGMPIYIPMYAIQRDPQFFPNPDQFNPDRFAPENKHLINQAAYMPFGHGPHNCIGERFGLLQTKVGLISFLRNHYVTPCAKSHPVMKLDPRALIIQSQGGIYCNLVRDPLL